MKDIAKRLRRPPPLEQLGPGPGLEHDARRAVEGPRDDELALGRPLHSRADLRRGQLTRLLASIDLFLLFQFLDNLVQLVEA